MEMMAPIGSSTGRRAMRATMSANSRTLAPTIMEAGMRSRWSPPTSMRAECGTISPRKPIMPQKATDTAVRTETISIEMVLKPLTFSPRWRACSSPSRITFSSRANSSSTSESTSTVRMMINDSTHVM